MATNPISPLSADRLSVLSVSCGHRTWARTFQCKPEHYLKPTTVEEVQAIVKLANEKRQSINLTGSGHSPSILTMNQNGWLMNLDRLNQVLSTDRHENYTDVTVQAGIRIYQINEYLAKNNLALQSLGSISDQSIAGIISTGTHGSSAYHGLVSNQLVSLSIVDGKGDLHFCSENENQELFRAALCSLGKIGIIVEATVRAVPAFKLSYKQEIVSFRDLVSPKYWPSVWTSSEFIRVWWYPYTDNVILWRADRADNDAQLTEPPYSFYATRFGRFFYESLLWISVKLAPSWTPYIERWVFNHQYGNLRKEPATATRGSVESFNMDCLFSQFVNEWACPLEKGLDVLLELEKEIKLAAKNGTYYVHSPFEVRVSNTSMENCEARPDFIDESGSPVRGYDSGKKGAVPGNFVKPYLNSTPVQAYSNPPSVSSLNLHLNATIYRPFRWDAPIDEWYKVFERILYKANGKPHWAKNFLGPDPSPDYKPAYDGEMRGLAPWLPKMYGEDLQSWKHVREAMDPNGIFLPNNDWAKINGLL